MSASKYNKVIHTLMKIRDSVEKIIPDTKDIDITYAKSLNVTKEHLQEMILAIMRGRDKELTPK